MWRSLGGVLYKKPGFFRSKLIRGSGSGRTRREKAQTLSLLAAALYTALLVL